MPTVQSLDHLVLTVADVEATVAFYRDVLGMKPEQFHPADGSTRWAMLFGSQKINLHKASATFSPHAHTPKPGSADLCFLSETPLARWQVHLSKMGVPTAEGPIARTGATGPIVSLYLRDPDGNLIEVSNRA